MTRRQDEAEAALHDQENLLPHKQLCLVFFVLALTLLVYFVDQNGIGQLLPTVAKDLHATETISWAGTSALIGNTVFQVLYGRLSDLFGRKGVYLSALALLCFSDLMCGVSRNATMLYVFRGLTGVAGGGITSLTMMIVSDIVTLERRGKYQGILGSMVGLGNLIGPLLAGLFGQTSTWRTLFYMLCPTAAACGFVSWWLLPSNMPAENFRANVKKIDYWGVTTASISLILLLIPVSGGGAYFEWNSPMVISMLVIGGIFAILFIYVEWRVSALPMMPLSLFKNTPVAAILLQNFFFGAVFYTYIYYLPLYYQNVRQFSPLKSAFLTIPLTLTQSFASICSGQYISRRKRYGEVIWFGFAVYTLGISLTTIFGRETAIWKNIVILMVLGLGTGNVFQPTIIALQAHCYKSQRAVVISVRNFLRCLGGSVGLAISAAVLQNVLKASLPEQYKYLAKTTYAKPDYTKFSHADGLVIQEAYAKASRAVFIYCAPLAGICLLTCLFVTDRGLVRPGEEPKPNPDAKSTSDGENGDGGVTSGKDMEKLMVVAAPADERDESEKEDDIAVSRVTRKEKV
ncbi:MFS general substrate transporter [Trichodelitschia bisporula]|uniref:MFS general substrate transporter n=1 Tax=Trichodelitschia bisporula TaxID=703511 RepID=A0A6G1HXD3_9PEZI|nr:MFS general substrate transporter [Trichodelitschia bisporula]